MEMAQRKPGKGFIIFLSVTLAFLVLYIASFILVGVTIGNSHNPAIADFGALMKYHINGIGDLFLFRFNNASNIIYFDFSCMLYALIVLWAAFLIVGLVGAIKRKRWTIIYGLVVTLLVVVVFMFGATGVPQYWIMLNKWAPYDKNAPLMLFAIGVIVWGILYAIAAYAFYFVCIYDTYKNPASKELEEEPVKEEKAVEAIPEEKQPVREEDAITKQDLAELIREIVRDEMSRHAPEERPQSPLIIQYFGSEPIKQEVRNQMKEQPKVEPKKEPEPEVIVPEEPVKEEPVMEQTAPVEEEQKNKIIRIPFPVRMMNADDEMKKNYNELKNEILSYGVNFRVSSSGDAFRLHRKTYVKITIAGLSLKLYFALNPDDYKDSPIPVQNAGHKGIYADIPLVFKVKSGLSMRRAKELIQTVMEKDGFEQGPIENIDWVEKLKEQPVDETED